MVQAEINLFRSSCPRALLEQVHLEYFQRRLDGQLQGRPHHLLSGGFTWRTRCNCCKLQLQKSLLNIRKKSLIMRQRLNSGKYLLAFKTPQGKALNNKFWQWSWPCFYQAAGLGFPEAPSSLNYSPNLCKTDIGHALWGTDSRET